MEIARQTDVPASLYIGDVMHARLKPVGHRFRYRVMSMVIDIDRLAEAGRLSWLFGVNRRGIYSFHESDHGHRDGSPIRPYIETLLVQNGVDLTGGRVLLLCYPRLFGYVFNPLSIYYCYDRSGALAALIYEVRNTFGELHSYIRPITQGEVSSAGIRQVEDKAFYVSPFIPMAMRYHFRLTEPGDHVRIRILETDADGPLLAAAFSGKRRALTTSTLVGMLVRLPFMTAKVIGGIHWEAMKLWLKGLPIQPRIRQAQN
jgi:DUF1365 family protein